MSLTPTAARLHHPPHPSYLKSHTDDSHSPQTYELTSRVPLNTSTLSHVTSLSSSQQSTISTQSASDNIVASTTPSSIETWLKDISQEASTSTSGSITSFSESPAPGFTKRKKSLSSNSHSEQRKLRRVPLKKRHLESHLAALDFPTMAEVYQEGDDVSIGSKGKSSDKTALWVKERMAIHNILQDHPSFESYPDFQAAVRRPFDQNRQYKVRPKSVELFQQKLNYLKDGNEESFKHAVLGLIIKEEFDVLDKPGENDKDPVYRSSIPQLEGIVSKFSTRLRPGYLPHTYNNSTYEKKNVLKRLQDEGLLTPEPDGIWGFDPAKLPQNKFEPDTQELMTLCKKMHWPFFVMQCKLDANYDETLNQVRRDGAAIVNTALLLMQKAGYPIDKPGPNYETYIYSMTMSKWIVQWWVHWSEIDTNGDRSFHMNNLQPSLMLEGNDLLNRLRNHLHTIIEWGLQKRMVEVKSRYAAIAQADEKAKDRALQRKCEANSSAGKPISTGGKRPHSRRDSNNEEGAQDSSGRSAVQESVKLP